MRPLASTALVLCLAACSVDPAPDNSESTMPAARPTPVSGPSPAAAAPTDAHVAPRPGELRTFGDWTVGCDNTRLCTMASLAPNDGDFPDATMEVTRQPGPAGGFELAVAGVSDNTPDPAELAIGAARFPTSELTGDAARRIVAAMVSGSMVDVRTAGGGTIGSVSLKGAAAALRYIDAHQGRAGTVTAAVARGRGPAATVPPRRPAPVIVAPALSGTAAEPTEEQLAAMRRLAECDDERIAQSPDTWAAEAHALGGGRTLVLLPCSTGAYNLTSVLFIIEPDGRFAPATTDQPSGFAESDASAAERIPGVVNGSFENGELSSYAKGRGLGDCGVSQAFVWDGRTFRLAEQSQMGECRGNNAFITTWRTTVVRR